MLIGTNTTRKSAGEAQGMRLTVLGARGSVPRGGAQFMEFGGDTSCYLVECCGESFILDAGTGILQAPVTFKGSLHILLSHLHLDHLLGLAMYSRLMRPDERTDLLLPVASVNEANDALNGLFGKPYWPVNIKDLPGNIRIGCIPRRLEAGDVSVSFIEGNHPGGCKVMRIEGAGRSLVYATDYEADIASFARLVKFCRDADLIMYDAQYREDALAAHAGFGHSTAACGMRLKDHSKAKRLLLIHHDPAATDEELLERERAIGRDDVRYAREGEVISV